MSTVGTLRLHGGDAEYEGQKNDTALTTLQLNGQLSDAAAEALGMRYVFFPVVSGRITAENVKDFGELLKGLDKPLLLFCRSGARSTMLYEAATEESDR